MEILMVAAELSPYARAGETADSVAALSRDVGAARSRSDGGAAALLELRGAGLARGPASDAAAACRRARSVTVFDGQLGSGVKIALFDAPEFFASRACTVRGSRTTRTTPGASRLLAQAAAALAVQRAGQGQAFDVAHLHDWPGALAAIALAPDGRAAARRCSRLHDLGRDGSFPSRELANLGIAEALNDEAGSAGSVRRSVCLKGGIQMADVVTTVSPTLCARTGRVQSTAACSRRFSKRAAKSCRGSCPGWTTPCTTRPWTPRCPAASTPRTPANKGICKTALIRRLELDFDPRRPLVVVLGPLTKERGADLVAQVAARIIDQDATLVVAGTGDLRPASARCRPRALTERDNYAYMEEAEGVAERRLLAAADFVLSPRPLRLQRVAAAQSPAIRRRAGGAGARRGERRRRRLRCRARDGHRVSCSPSRTADALMGASREGSRPRQLGVAALDAALAAPRPELGVARAALLEGLQERLGLSAPSGAQRVR